MGKTLIKVVCADQQLFTSVAPTIASGGQNEDRVEFEFCPLWEGFEKTAVFRRDDGGAYCMALENDACTIPHEVLTDEGWMYFGVFGIKDGARRTSAEIKYRIERGAVVGEAIAPSEPTPDVYTQYVNRIAAVEKFTIKPGTVYTETGELVQMDNFEGMPMDVITTIPLSSNGGANLKLYHAGKNLVMNQYRGQTYENSSKSGKWVGNADGSVTVTGTAPSSSRIACGMTENGMLYLPAGTYYVSGTPAELYGQVTAADTNKGGPAYFQVDAFEDDDGKPASAVYDYGKGATFVMKRGGYVWLSICIRAGYTLENVTFHPQIERIARTEYEPYVNSYVSVEFGETVYGGQMNWNTGELTVMNESEEPRVIQLTATELRALAGVNTLYATVGETTVSGRKDILALVNGLIEKVAALEAAAE